MMTGTQPPKPTLASWNDLDASTAAEAILPCNGSGSWAAGVVALRPFHSPEALFAASDRIWRALPASDWQQAFDSHPRIGERHAKAATSQSLQWSSGEQSSAQLTTDTQTALADANAAYEQKFGRIFIVCASGKTAAEMLAILRTRLTNDPQTELLEAAEQQRQITQLRLHKWLGAPT
jgi:2-oxo-4-hydroxy-4-carboxy-5-ureidoimidazoline decarboxylase